MLAPGLRADVNVIDLDRLTLHPPMLRFDLPAGGKRLLQRADGYLHTFVAGAGDLRDGEHTGALPGRLVRGARRPHRLPEETTMTSTIDARRRPAATGRSR